MSFVTMSFVTMSFVTMSFVTMSFVTMSFVTMSFVTMSFVTMSFVTMSFVTMSFVTMSATAHLKNSFAAKDAKKCHYCAGGMCPTVMFANGMEGTNGFCATDPNLTAVYHNHAP